MAKVRVEARTEEAVAALSGLSTLVREYVAGSAEQPYWDQLRALPRYVDDAERDFGFDLYDRMMRDSMVSAAVDTLRMKALAPGLRLVPADESPEARVLCDRTADLIQDVDLNAAAFDQLLAVAYGSRLAEMVFRPVGGRYWLDRLSVKPRHNYALVLDSYLRLEAVVGIVPGKNAWLPGGVLVGKTAGPGWLPKEKFWLLTLLGRGDDPRGTSMLRSAYNAWWMKQQTWPQLLKYLVQFAGPSLIGYTPEHATSVGPRTPEELMLSALRGFQNGSIVVLRGGSKVDRIQSDGDGRAFLDSIDMFNREITHAVLKQTRATMEAEHGSKADSETASGTLDVLVQWLQSQVCESLRRQVVRRVVELNFGTSAVRLLPRVSMGPSSRLSFTDHANAIAQLARSGYLDANQYARIDAMLGLPARA